uniref:Uncharacterized protein n=1 Tax=Clytia hemisphaerica TaxID=252671 RepID=A0A7M5WLA2_9CNID
MLCVEVIFRQSYTYIIIVLFKVNLFYFSAKNTKMKVEKRFNRFYCEKRPKAACSTNQTTDLVVNKEQQVREEMEARMNEMKEKHEREMNELRASIKEHQEENEDQNQDEDDMLLEEGNELENSPPTEAISVICIVLSFTNKGTIFFK